MRKKVIATVLAASMALTLAPTFPVGTGTTAQAGQKGAGLASVFDAIQTQPVVKYTFDDAEGLELAGEAKVEGGVLDLATSGTNGVTYAKLPDLSTTDFANGVTLVADIKVAGYTSDWTPIFMIGDGALGKDGADATAIYHFSQGFSSVGGLQGNFFEGYFGNEISAPYTWDYFSNTANQNIWMKVAVTISESNMATYINGQKVQEATGSYANVIKAFSVGNSNYLGTSYWVGDPDFVGSMDNVGIYNVALSSDDVAAIANAEVSEEPGDVTVPDDTEEPGDVTEPGDVEEPSDVIEPGDTEDPGDVEVPGNTEEPAGLTVLDDLACPSFWSAHTQGQQVTSSELFFGFKSVTSQIATDNWNCPVAVIYSSADGAVYDAGTAGYTEYWVVRGDAYGWAGANNTASVDSLLTAGIEFMPENLPADDTAWATWKAENKSGVRCEGSVQLVDGRVVLKFTVNGVTSTSTIPVSADGDVYLAFTGDACTLSNIKFSGNEEEARLTDEELNAGQNGSSTDAKEDEDEDSTNTTTTKKKITISSVTAKKNTKKITGKVSVKKATVKVKVGSKAFKKATVKAKKFTYKTTSKLKKGTKVKIKVTKTGCKKATTTVTVK